MMICAPTLTAATPSSSSHSPPVGGTQRPKGATAHGTETTLPSSVKEKNTLQAVSGGGPAALARREARMEVTATPDRTADSTPSASPRHACNVSSRTPTMIVTPIRVRAKAPSAPRRGRSPSSIHENSIVNTGWVWFSSAATLTGVLAIDAK